MGADSKVLSVRFCPPNESAKSTLIRVLFCNHDRGFGQVGGVVTGPPVAGFPQIWALKASEFDTLGISGDNGEYV